MVSKPLQEAPVMSLVALVTGSTTGIGRLTSETLARAGHTVYASMREIKTRNAAAAEEVRSFATPIGMDVRDSGSVQRAVDRVMEEAGRIDVVVNNAGVMSIGLAEGFTEEQVAYQMDVNFMGT